MNRDFYFDNVKGALITLVVIGHFLLPMERTRFVSGLIYVIYLFHMPMFAMVSGYFAKGVYRRQTGLRADKVLRLVWLYILFEAAVHVTENLAAGMPVTGRIDFFWEDGAPWYLLAMIWWYLSLPLAAELKPGTVMTAALCLGLLGGYQDSLGDGLAMSRTLTFAPFFYGGYYLSHEQVEAFQNSSRKWLAAGAALAIGAVTVLGAGSFLGPFTGIVYGMNYRILADWLYSWGAVVRIIWYGAAAVMIGGMMAVIPRARFWWTALGQRTLQVYVLHRLLRDMMQYWGFYERVTSQYRRNVVFTMALAVAAAAALSGPHITKIFAWLQKPPEKLYRRWKRE